MSHHIGHDQNMKCGVAHSSQKASHFARRRAQSHLERRQNRGRIFSCDNHFLSCERTSRSTVCVPSNCDSKSRIGLPQITNYNQTILWIHKPQTSCQNVGWLSSSILYRCRSHRKSLSTLWSRITNKLERLLDIKSIYLGSWQDLDWAPLHSGSVLFITRGINGPWPKIVRLSGLEVKIQRTTI